MVRSDAGGRPQPPDPPDVPADRFPRGKNQARSIRAAETRCSSRKISPAFERGSSPAEIRNAPKNPRRTTAVNPHCTAKIEISALDGVRPTGLSQAMLTSRLCKQWCEPVFWRVPQVPAVGLFAVKPGSAALRRGLF